MVSTDNFTTIPLREFQLHASKYVTQLPLILTKYNKVVALVVKSSNEGINVAYAEEEEDIPARLTNPVRLAEKAIKLKEEKGGELHPYPKVYRKK
jgi:hypothetical protein